MAGPSRLPLPRRRPNYRFGFTAFADTMFQLLIFFILSSSLTPYSLLTLRSAPPPGDGAAAPGEETTAEPGSGAGPGQVALWTVTPGGLVVGGEEFGFEMLPALAGALGTDTAPAEVVLILRAAARVQDVATVLAALQKANVGAVRISSGSG